jgi:PAS domain S-box-containing protein
MTEQTERTVLYVDDDECNRNTFALVLREAGFEVKEAATGSEALLLAEEKPDVVVLDVNLPDINGVEVCRHIKKHPATRAIPVMHVSAVYVTPEDKTYALDEGADAYVTKPVEPRELVARVKALLRIHRAEERATVAARRWQATFAAINDGVCLLDRQGRVLSCNPAAERVLQRPAHEIVNRQCDDLIAATSVSGECSVFRRMLETRCRETAEVAVGDRWLQTIADPVVQEDGDPAGALYILSDITERKSLEEQLRLSQEMEAVGRLAGGLANEFNNLLTAMTGNASLILAETPEQDPHRELLLAIDRAAWRGAELNAQLLDYSRRSAPRLLPTDLRSCLEEISVLLGRTLDPRITLEVRSGADLWMVAADSGQINQVLMNLCFNARDAMPEGGHLLLEVENAVANEGQAGHSMQNRPGEFVRVRVSDSGRGIAPKVMPRVFESYFTTRAAGGGTGLGLATIFSIVSQHRGWIECARALDKGTCFTMYLPRCEAHGRPTPPLPRPTAPIGTETILLVDDEPMVRTVGQEILRRHGYKVLTAEDGEQATNSYEQEQDRVSLVVLDLNVPRRPWRDTLRCLLLINPRVRVLLTSGHGTHEVGSGTEGVVGFLAKPFRSEDLAIAVRRALDSGNSWDASGGGECEWPASASTGALTEFVKTERVPRSTAEVSCSTSEECRSDLSKAEAEEMLDWLEAQGFQKRSVRLEEDKGFTVRWETDSKRGEHRCRRLRRRPCPRCGCTSQPYVVREMGKRSWLLAGVGLLVWPLLVLGLLLRRDVWRCENCHSVLGRGRRLTLKW